MPFILVSGPSSMEGLGDLEQGTWASVMIELGEWTTYLCPCSLGPFEMVWMPHLCAHCSHFNFVLLRGCRRSRGGWRRTAVWKLWWRIEWARGDWKYRWTQLLQRSAKQRLDYPRNLMEMLSPARWNEATSFSCECDEFCVLKSEITGLEVSRLRKEAHSHSVTAFSNPKSRVHQTIADNKFI